MKAIIVAGGDADITQLKDNLSTGSHDLLIAADSGADHILSAGFVPDVIVGDFDSISADRSALASEIITYPPEKDFTDAEAAFDHAIKSGSDEIVIYGATGRRLDHFLGNLSLLIKADGLGVKCCIKDEHNVIRLVSSDTGINKSESFGDYISIIPIDDNVCISLEGFKYPLDNYRLTRDNALGVSNEVKDDIAYIRLISGRVLLIESK